MAASETQPNKPTKPRKPRIDRKTPILRIQKMIASIERRITAPDTEATPQDQKLKPREMIGLANSAASLSRILRDVDKETSDQAKAKKGSKGLTWND
jgi:hypothetical protein